MILDGVTGTIVAKFYIWYKISIMWYESNTSPHLSGGHRRTQAVKLIILVATLMRI